MLEPGNETFNQVFDQCMAIAKDHLENFGEFYPFGCYVDRNGKFVITGGYTGEEHPGVTDILTLLDTDLSRALADGEALITFLAVNVNIPDIWEAPYATASGSPLPRQIIQH